MTTLRSGRDAQPAVLPSGRSQIINLSPWSPAVPPVLLWAIPALLSLHIKFLLLLPNDASRRVREQSNEVRPGQ